jgi:hypothetical protein
MNLIYYDLYQATRLENFVTGKQECYVPIPCMSLAQIYTNLLARSVHCTPTSSIWAVPQSKR